MSERFYVESTPSGGRATLAGDEARHLARVLRAKPGDTVTLFDGRGGAWTARVAAVGRDRVDLDVGDALPPNPPPRAAVTIAVALPKGDRQKWLVEKLAELGVESLVPLTTTRGVAEATEAARARLERGVIEACKQCGRDTLMTIHAPASLADAIASAGAETTVLLADPAGPPLDEPPAGATLVLVGPEGGFTPEEIDAATTRGARRVSLGRHVLRIETAAIAAAARLA